MSNKKNTEICVNNSASPRSRRFLLWLAAIVVLGLLLRLMVCAELADIRSVSNPWSGTDMATYKATAISILEGHWPEYFYYQPFYYAVFLPLIYLIFGVGVWGPMLVQVVLGAVTIWLTGLVAAHVFGRKAGLFAALLLALSRFHIFYTPFLLIAVLQSFWLILLTYLCLYSFRRNSWWAWLSTALVTSAAILTRGNILLFVPGILLLLIWRNRNQWRRALGWSVIFLILLYLPQLPFALRNYQHYGRWTGPSAAQDAVLALGNTPEAPPGGLEYPKTYQDWMELANQPVPDRVPVSHQILNWIENEPLAFVELQFRKFLLFWHNYEIPNNIAFAREGRDSALLNLPILFNFGLIGVLGLAGMFLNWKLRSPFRWFLYFEVLVYCAATVLFYILARFRLPLVPLLCVFAGGFCRHILSLWRQRKKMQFRQKFMVALLAIVVALFLGFKALPLYQQTLGKNVLRWVRPSGVVSLTQNRLLIYDHGPRSSLGWNFLPVTEAGLTVEKAFKIPESRIETAQLSEPTLRIYLQGVPGSRVQITLIYSSGQRLEKRVVLQDQQPFQVRIPLDACLKGSPKFKMQFKTLLGEAYLIVDEFRDYGRTTYLGPDGVPLDISAEAVIELHWDVVRTDKS